MQTTTERFNSSQWLSVGLAVCLLIGLWAFGNTRPATQTGIDRARALALESTDAQSLIVTAQKTLSADKIATQQVLEKELNAATADSAKANVYQKMSAHWYEWGHPAIAGFFAQQVAEMRKTDEAWGIAGTTFSIGAQRATEEKVKTYCADNAVKAFENAISLNPQQVEHRINLALCYAEHPPQDNPMKGILLLLDLNKQYPENVGVLVQLGRLGIKTGQYDKAIDRLQKAVALAPDNKMAYCLLADAFTAKGNTAEAEAAAKKCQQQ